MMEQKSRNGFTLLEVLVVVVIVGVLAGIATPQYTKILDRVSEAEPVGNLGALLTAQYVHFLEHNQFTVSGDQLMVTPAPLRSWTYPGSQANVTWTVTPTSAEVVLTSQGHPHGTPASHQIRGTSFSDGTFRIEVKRPGEASFHPL